MRGSGMRVVSRLRDSGGLFAGIHQRDTPRAPALAGVPRHRYKDAELDSTRTVRSSAEYETANEQLSRMVPALQFDMGVMST